MSLRLADRNAQSNGKGVSVAEIFHASKFGDLLELFLTILNLNIIIDYQIVFFHLHRAITFNFRSCENMQSVSVKAIAMAPGSLRQQLLT